MHFAKKDVKHRNLLYLYVFSMAMKCSKWSKSSLQLIVFMRNSTLVLQCMNLLSLEKIRSASYYSVYSWNNDSFFLISLIQKSYTKILSNRISLSSFLKESII
jgi:hypothetical protein